MNSDSLFILDEIPEALSRDENLDLLKRAKSGDEKAKDHFIRHNLRLVIYEVNTKFVSCNFDKRDLVAVGCEGLLRAIDYYDFDKNIEFSSYASSCIDKEIRKYLVKNYDKGRIVSFDNFRFSDDDTDYLDVLDSGISIESDYDDKELICLLNDFISSMSDMNKIVFALHFGFCGKRYTYDEIAKMFNCSRSWIAKIIDNNLSKMRCCMNDYGFVGGNDIKGRWKNKRK